VVRSQSTVHANFDATFKKTPVISIFYYASANTNCYLFLSTKHSKSNQPLVGHTKKKINFILLTITPNGIKTWRCHSDVPKRFYNLCALLERRLLVGLPDSDNLRHHPRILYELGLVVVTSFHQSFSSDSGDFSLTPVLLESGIILRTSPDSLVGQLPVNEVVVSIEDNFGVLHGHIKINGT
jgi:hypothetical protein